jgi:hypothetical protein
LKDNIKVDRKEIRWERVDWIFLAQDRKLLSEPGHASSSTAVEVIAGSCTD